MEILGYVLLGLVFIGLIILFWGMFEASWLKISTDKIVVTKDEGRPDLRILYFSDLHREFCLVPPQKVIELIRSEKQSEKGLDAVVFGGDISNSHEHAVHGLKYLQSIADACKELSVPYMAVTGNHDAFVPAEELGMFSFDNMDGCIKYLKSQRDGRYIAFAGVPDTGRKDRVWATPPTPLAGIDYKTYVLLSHNPDISLHLPELPFKIDVMLSGHIHGGQIRTPFGLEFFLRRDELPYKGIISGLHDINGIKVFISKGIGCVLLPVRIGARPEINIIELYC